MFSQELHDLVGKLAVACLDKGESFAVAESCTGGLLAGAITAMSGVSAWFYGGFVTYSNRSKESHLGVDPNLIHRVGAVSAEVAEAMASGVIDKTGVAYALSITGIAGPEGGSVQKPVGTVWIGSATRLDTYSMRYLFEGDRHQIRMQAVQAALKQGLEILI